MPGWMGGITLEWIIATLAGAAVIWGTVRKVGKPIKRTLDTLTGFMATWNGTPEVRDESGAFVKAAVPGIPAQLETIRAQVQNSHSTNLRDDLDRLHATVDELVAKVEEHITIAKESDGRQDETERIVNRYLPMLQTLVEES